MRSRLSVPVLACICVLATGASAQQEPRATFRSDVDLVLHAVAVLDPRGEPVADLTVEEFRIYEGDVAQQIDLFLAPNETPLDVALVLDSSNSLVPWGRIVRRSAQTFLTSLEIRDCVYLLPFNDSVGAGTWGRAFDPAMSRRVDGIFMDGGTALYDALLQALHSLQIASIAAAEPTAPAADAEPTPASAAGAEPATPRPDRCGVASPAALGQPQRRRAVVLLTDGADENSQARFDEVLEMARSTSIPVFPVVLGEARKDERLRATLDAIAGNSGGRVIETVSADRLRGAYDDVVALLRASYLLGYRLAVDADAEPAWRDVRIRSRRPGFRLVYRPRYFR